MILKIENLQKHIFLTTFYKLNFYNHLRYQINISFSLFSEIQTTGGGYPCKTSNPIIIMKINQQKQLNKI